MISWQTIQTKLKEIAHLEKILALLSWDQETYMPPAATKSRSEQISFLVGEWHKRICDPWWDEVFTQRETIPDLSSDHKRILEIFKKDREKEVKIPLELATALATAVSEAFQAWQEARSQSDFSLFQPALQKIFDLSLEKAAALGYERENAYDAFLDLHEEGLTQKDFDPLAIEALKVIQKVLHTIQEKSTPPRKDFLSRNYPIEKQQLLCTWILPRIGFDTQRGRLDVSPHPFSTTIALDDVRLTTRYSENDPLGSLYSVLHEAGHGLYEQGFLPQWEDTPLAQAISLGIHESQSRFWENQIGRSMEFLTWLWPEMKRTYNGFLDDVTVEEVFRAVNEVKPSFIRTEADEVTYGLHIIIRYEIEKKLFAGEITLSEAPEVWNSLYTSYLGITPQNAREGILQDVHWSHGSFGYFPTYLLGNLYASQWYAVMGKTLDIPSLVRKGEFQPILEWMRTNIHQHGRRYDAQTLCERISGEPLNVVYFASYLKQRYESVYGISLPL
ncbi:carboxypeptidase M32 [Thermospira aquatica]|uniref:Metal-dependent carboxypeptidase n=1 Tax=Thermospira aquatica TaxID=2828656 RepID=A0AAX3BA75_9SPIR|nr:carboxypeptidase M32 [Thermospira aquatica]URA09155.1 carboxypeptidase M32 [Thermospira aquatica]